MEKRFKTMKERPVTERPYEKCQETGPESLTDGELLAVILRTGTREHSVLEMCWDLLTGHPTYKGLLGLCHMDREMLMRIPGIGEVKACQVLCLVELSKRLSRTSLPEARAFSDPEYIAAYYMEHMRHMEKEKVLLLLLDVKLRLIREIVLSQGTEDSAQVPVKTVFQEALRNGASRMILIHNHPSGHPEPSREDLVLTRRIREMGEMFDIPLLDHIIIGDRCYISLREEGQLNF